MVSSADFPPNLSRIILTAETEMVSRWRNGKETGKLNQMSAELQAIGKPYAQLLGKMKRGQQITVPFSGGKFLTIRKDSVYLNQGLLMAISKNSEMDLTEMGYATRTSEIEYSERFLQMENWQMVDFSLGKQTAYCWDKGALAKTDAYGRHAVTVLLSGFEGNTKDEIKASFNNKGKLISIPKSAWQQVAN